MKTADALTRCVSLRVGGSGLLQYQLGRMPHVRTVVTFRSTAFNTAERRPYFVNDGCFGDDVARWLIAELQSHGVVTDCEPDQEDCGWYFSFRPGDTEHQFIIGYRPGSGEELGTWIGWVERRAGLIGSLLGARSRGIEPSALRAIHDVLVSDRRVSSVRWHWKTDFDATNESTGASEPDAA